MDISIHGHREESDTASAGRPHQREHDWARGETETASIISKQCLIWVTGPR